MLAAAVIDVAISDDSSLCVMLDAASLASDSASARRQTFLLRWPPFAEEEMFSLLFVVAAAVEPDDGRFFLISPLS